MPSKREELYAVIERRPGLFPDVVVVGEKDYCDQVSVELNHTGHNTVVEWMGDLWGGE